MVKKQLDFEISYPLKRKVVRNCRIETDYIGELIITGTAYHDPSVASLDIAACYNVDIDFIRWQGTDVRELLVLWDQLEEVERYCRQKAVLLFATTQKECAL